MDNKDTGILLNKKNIELHRAWFKQMTKLIGINVLYRAPRSDKHYDQWGELDSNYQAPEIVGCIFDDHPTQSTMKKLGWNAELNDSLTLIHVPYDLKDLQTGSLFIVPSGIDNSQGRVFRVIRMKVSPIYPASITCELGPMLKNNVDKSIIHDFKQTDFNVLNTPEEEDY